MLPPEMVGEFVFIAYIIGMIWDSIKDDIPACYPPRLWNKILYSYNILNINLLIKKIIVKKKIYKCT